MRNKLSDLNNHLFVQLERLNDDDLNPEEIKQEINRAKAMASVGKVIVDNASIVLDAKKYVDEFDLKDKEIPDVLRIISK